MKQYNLLLLILLILLSGCSEIRYAKAKDIQARTKRANEWHALLVEGKEMELAEQAALKTTRIAAKGNLIWSGMIGGVILIIALAGSFSYYTIGISIAKVKQANLMLIPLDKMTRQYPLVIGNGSQVYNPNTLASSTLLTDSLPHPELLQGSHNVQMIGTGAKYNSFAEYEKEVMLIK